MLWSATIAVLLCLPLQLAVATDVFAHFMMQNAYAYDQNQWTADMQSAQSIGIDGFALNWGPPNCNSDMSWQVARMDQAYAVAQTLGFKIMQSFDMSYTVCNQYWDIGYMVDKLIRYNGYSSTYRWNGKIMVSTFGGEAWPYGNQFFQTLKNTAAYYGYPITLSPALLSYSYSAQDDPSDAANRLLHDYPSIDGYFNWQAWPLDRKQNISIIPDITFRNALKQASKPGPYIMAVSPWQYKDLNDSNVQDAWVQYTDYLFPQRWQSLIGGFGFQADIVEILTWNDFTESHYIRNLPSTDMSATDYVQLGQLAGYINSMSHAPWRTIAWYYIYWMKHGTPPTITSNQVVVWYRTHPRDAVCLFGSSTSIRNKDLPNDGVFFWAIAPGPAQISLSVGSHKFYRFSNDGSGPFMGVVPFPDEVYSGGTAVPELQITGSGGTQINHGSQGITSNCAYQNFNANVFLVGNNPNFGP